MSYQTQTWAAQQRTGDVGIKATLMALANYADENHSCYPSQATLAYDTEQGERTVRRQLKHMEESGFLQRTPQGRRDGGRGPDRYILAVPPQEVSGQSGQEVSGQSGQGVSGQIGGGFPAIAVAGELPEELPENLFAAEQARPPKKPRPPDPVWDAMVGVCGLTGATPTPRERDAWNGAAKGLRVVQATPDEISRRGAEHRRRWPQASLTPTSLARHWAELSTTSEGSGGMTEAEYRAEKARPAWL